MELKVINGDNLEILKNYPDNYFDAVVTDPPYGLGKEPNAEELMKDWIEKGYHEVKGSGFMGKDWDAFVPQPIFWKEVFRVLKHGGHVVSFFGTRTYDWGVMAMRFAGFEVRDCIQWLYGSGFPKSHNISKAIDKMYGAEREVVGEKVRGDVQKAKENGSGYLSDPANRNNEKQFGYGTELITKASTDQAKEWEGWGSALKPAHEDLVLARKPFKFSSDFVYLYENIVYNLKLQICQSKLFAKDVKEIFTLSQKELQGVELDFAQWSVEKSFNTKEDLLVLMDMLQLEMKEENTTLNIVLLWLNTLVELWNVANTYTTETESSTITELRILNSLEWESIFQNITLLKDNKTNGLIANVLTVESLFSVLNLKLNDILTHSVRESATLKESEKTFVPNSEQIVLARKPLEKGLSIAENVLKWGTGAINIDGCRVGFTDNVNMEAKQTTNNLSKVKFFDNDRNGLQTPIETYKSNGRFPANLILTHHPECECVGLKKVGKGERKQHADGEVSSANEGYTRPNKSNFTHKDSSVIANYGEETIENWNCHEDCPIKILDEQSGVLKSGDMNGQYHGFGKHGIYGKGGKTEALSYGDKGGASRFFYVAKASKSERNKGLEGFEEKASGSLNFRNPSSSGRSEDAPSVEAMGGLSQPKQNFHPTIKPIKLMQYLVRLVTPPNGIVLDPFCGSGTTGIACKLEGFQFVGIEQDPEYHKIADARVKNYTEDSNSGKKQKIKGDNKKNKLEQLNLFNEQQHD